MKRLTFILALLLLHGTIKAEDIFYWKWQLTEGQVKITGKLNNEPETIVYAESGITKKRFATLYRIVDEIEYSRISLYNKTIDTLSSLLISPFASSILNSRVISIEIDSSLINFPIEFLKIKTTAIALIRPLVFTISGNHHTSFTDSVTLHRGFIVRDPTSDPENACGNIFRQYPASEFKSAYKIHEKDLGIKNDIDFILISAHGDADSITFKGGIALNKIDNVSPVFFKENNPKIVYIDGCQQGMNWAYISALLETGEPNFYLGPLISNDSGESSTKTINWFFAYLQQTHSPVTSMWETRKKLYGHYNGKIKTLDVINKSFIFRVYKL